MGKTRSANIVVEYINQRHVKHMVKNAENARRRTIGQSAVRASLLMKQNNM